MGEKKARVDQIGGRTGERVDTDIVRLKSDSGEQLPGSFDERPGRIDTDQRPWVADIIEELGAEARPTAQVEGHLDPLGSVGMQERPRHRFVGSGHEQEPIQG